MPLEKLRLSQFELAGRRGSPDGAAPSPPVPNIAGGDSREPVDNRDTRFPIPEDWRALVKGLKDPPPFSSDAFLDLLWPDSN